jgi:sugar (pentulose or hexulose) kinase
MAGSIAVLDIGKTNAKLAVVDSDGLVREGLSRTNAVHVLGGVRALDVSGIEAWLIESLGTLARETRIAAIVPVAHGASAAYLRGAHLAVHVLDYEAELPLETLVRYRLLRDPFAQTFSPPLSMGLNLGAQLYWQEDERPALRDESIRIVPWPQYWAWWLSGVAASEVTSLGCHTDLWSPASRDYSGLAKQQGWSTRFAPLRKAGDVLGRLRPELVAQTGLSPDCEILCGLHDSNAALLAARGVDAVADREFALVSTGTWFVAFASGISKWPPLDPLRDTLANIDVEGRPVPSARFMGGREYEAIMGADHAQTATIADAKAVVTRGVTTRPSFVEGSGPFPTAQGEIIGELRTPSERAALAALHLALMTVTSLDLIGAHGPVVLEGRFAANSIFASALASLCAPEPVLVSARADGIALGAARLRFPALRFASTRVVPLPFDIGSYAAAWRARAN